MRAWLVVVVGACSTSTPPPAVTTTPATGDLWTCACRCTDRAGGSDFVASVVGCAPIGLAQSIGSDRDAACASACGPGLESIAFREGGYIGPCTGAVAAADGFADGLLTGPSSCDPARPPLYPLTTVSAYHATLDPTRSTFTLDAVDHLQGALAGTVAFDFDVPLRFHPVYIFFEDIQLASTADPVVQVFEANDVFAGYAPAGTFSSSGVLPVRWRDASGARGIEPQGTWNGHLDLAARTLSFDLHGSDPANASWTFAMHVEAAITGTPPVANAGGDVSVPCAAGSGTSVVLDASASTDPDPGDAVTRFQWLGVGGSPAFGAAAMTTVLLPVGTSTFELHVYDAALAADSQMKRVTVTASASCP
ncbi:MAG TPA: hypothetical protein VLT45_30060 [Kofleriaceae bacterium]|nr:hypothetical protein [Kofleriaceae bacterium]